jgi:hypothetical protein
VLDDEVCFWEVAFVVCGYGASTHSRTDIHSHPHPLISLPPFPRALTPIAPLPQRDKTEGQPRCQGVGLPVLDAVGRGAFAYLPCFEIGLVLLLVVCVCVCERERESFVCVMSAGGELSVRLSPVWACLWWVVDWFGWLVDLLVCLCVVSIVGSFCVFSFRRSSFFSFLFSATLPTQQELGHEPVRRPLVQQPHPQHSGGLGDGRDLHLSFWFVVV